MSQTDIPYTPIGTPIEETVPYNGVTFKTVTWKVPPSTPHKGTIVYVHGFCERSILYTEFFDRLSQKGYEIFFFGQRGASETSPGKLMGKTDEFQTFDDLNFMIERVLAARLDNKEKLYLAGHSMGGPIAINYAIYGKFRDDIRGIFVSGPLIELHPKTKPNFIVMKLQPIINKILPSLKVDSKLDFDEITSNDGWKNYIQATEGKMIGTIRQFNDMFVRGWNLLDADHLKKFHSHIPLLVFHGEEDKINDIKGSEQFMKLLPKNVDAEFVSVPNARHSVFLEREEIIATVLEKVLDFLDGH